MPIPRGIPFCLTGEIGGRIIKISRHGRHFSLLYNRSTLYYYITNLEGDVIRLVDIYGQTAAMYKYDPFGNAIYATGSHAQINPLRYRSYYFDSVPSPGISPDSGAFSIPQPSVSTLPCTSAAATHKLSYKHSKLMRLSKIGGIPMSEQRPDALRCDPSDLTQAMSIHTSKITDACRDKDCIEDLQVYLTAGSQAILDTCASARVRCAELLYTYIDVETVAR